MSLRSKQYIIPLKPIGWARSGVIFAKKRFYDKQSHDKLAYGLYLAQQHNNEPLFEGPLWLDVIFHMAEPLTVRRRRTYKWHDGRPDLDNLEKFLQDAITDTGIIWKDDAVVSKKTSEKVYHPNTELIITITELL